MLFDSMGISGGLKVIKKLFSVLFFKKMVKKPEFFVTFWFL